MTFWVVIGFLVLLSLVSTLIIFSAIKLSEGENEDV